MCEARAREPFDNANQTPFAVPKLRKIADRMALKRELSAVIALGDGGTIAKCRIIDALGPGHPPEPAR